MKLIVLALFGLVSLSANADRIDYSSALQAVPPGTIAPREPVKNIEDSNGISQDSQPLIVFDKRSPEELIDEAKVGLLNRNKDYSQSITDLRVVIATQPRNSSFAKQAHEILGYAYEKGGDKERAMKEYQAYLNLYPEENEDRTRVRQRLMTIEIDQPQQKLGKIVKSKTPRQGDQQSISATVSEYAYTSSNTASSGLRSWHTDQVNALTGFQAQWKIEHNEYTLINKIRLSDIRDFTHPQSNKTNLSLAYIDLEDTFRGWDLKLGRQHPVAGATSKFDGISSRIGIGNDLRLIFAAGVPYMGAASNTRRKFGGAELEYDVSSDLTAAVYLNRGFADRFLERMAVGNEFDYKSIRGNIILRSEYDTLYHTWNLITLQGLRYLNKDWSVFGLYERRKSPSPYADVALGLGGLSPDKQVYNSISDLLTKSGLSSSDIYNYVEHGTAVATAAVFGATNQFAKNWTMTADFQVTNLSTLPGFNLTPQFDPVPVQIGQSNSYSASLHFRGDGFLDQANVIEIVMSNSSGARKSYFLTTADSYKFGDNNKNSVSLLARLDAFDQGYTKIKTVTGIFRVLFAISQNSIVEVQYSRALTYEPLLIVSNSAYSTGQNFYIGYRYDF